MFKIMTKTNDEIKLEGDLKRAMQKDNTDQDFRYVGRKICPTYVLTDDGLRIDTNRLSNEQIIALAKAGIQQQAANDQKGAPVAEDYIAALDLMRAVMLDYRPTLDDMQAWIDLYHHDNPSVQKYSSALLADSKVFHRRYNEIAAIAKFDKQRHGNFGDLDRADLQATVKQLKLNEEVAHAFRKTKLNHKDEVALIAEYNKQMNGHFDGVTADDLRQTEKLVQEVNEQAALYHNVMDR